MVCQQQARIVISFIFGLVVFAGVSTPAFSAPVPEARVVLNADRYVVGSRWTLDLLVDTPNPLQVKVSPADFPPELSLVDGPYIRETTWEKVPGILSRATKVSYTFKTLAPGIVEVGPFGVRVGATTQSVAPATVYLLSTDEANRRFPLEVGWKVPAGPFYEGQAIPLILQAKNLDTLVQSEDFNLPAPPGALWEKAVGLGEIEINSIAEDRLMNVPWGAWIVIPTKKGSLTIPGFPVTVAGLVRKVPPLVLSIASLPTEVSATRAVGNFSYTVDAKPGAGAQDGSLVVTQEVKGTGNFPYLVLPEVTLPGLTLTSRQEGTRYRASTAGYEGSLVVTWRFSAENPQSVVASLPGFVAFQPDTGLVSNWDAATVPVSVGTSAKVPVPQVEPLRVLDWNHVVAARSWKPGWLLVVLCLPGVVFWGLTFFVRGPEKGILIVIGAGTLFWGALAPAPEGFDAAYQATGYDAADRWDHLIEKYPSEPGLWYNKAVSCELTGRTSEAVYAYRMALLEGFQGKAAYVGLGHLEEKELLTDQFAPWQGWATNLVLILLVVAVNGMGIFAGVQRLTGATGWIIPLVVCFIAALTLGVILGTAEGDRHAADAVVGLSDGPIRKVPGDLSESWMTLKAGTVVKIRGTSDRWVLVQTGYGLEGWVESASLMRLVPR